MATYILQNTHRPEECESLAEEAQALPAPLSMKGTPLLCTCPSGAHGAVFTVQADSEAEALAMVGPKFRAGTRAYLGEIFEFGSEPLPVA
jgi:hypothetical protein